MPLTLPRRFTQIPQPYYDWCDDDIEQVGAALDKLFFEEGLAFVGDLYDCRNRDCELRSVVAKFLDRVDRLIPERFKC